MNNDQDQFNILNALDKNKDTTQRKLANILVLAWEIKLFFKSLNEKV